MVPELVSMICQFVNFPPIICVEYSAAGFFGFVAVGSMSYGKGITSFFFFFFLKTLPSVDHLGFRFWY